MMKRAVLATCVLLVVSVAVALWWGISRSEGPRGAMELGELLNLAGNPVPEDEPLRLRLLVVDAGLGMPSGAWVGPSQLAVQARRLGRELAAHRADVVVVFDARLDGPLDDVTPQERIAVEVSTPWWARVVTQRRLGVPGLAGRQPLRWAPVVVSSAILSRRPMEVVSSSAPAGRRATPSALAGPGPSAMSLVVQLHTPTGPVLPPFSVVDSGTQPADPTSICIVRSGLSGATLSTDDGRLGLWLPDGLVVEQSRTALRSELWLGDAMMADVRVVQTP